MILDKGRQYRRIDQGTGLLRDNARVLERLRCCLQQEELDPLGNTELWKRTAAAGHGHRPRRLTVQV